MISSKTRFHVLLSFLLLLLSVSAGGTERWLKLEVREDGIYKVRYEDLRQYGVLSEPVASKEIALLGLPAGQISPFNDSSVHKGTSPLSIWMQDGGDGVFEEGDYFLFYGQSPDILQYDAQDRISPFSVKNHPYSLSQYYFVCLDSTRHVLVGQALDCTQTPQQILTSFPDFIRYKKELANPLEGTESWLGEAFTESEPAHYFAFDLSYMQPGTLPQLEFSLATYGKKELSGRFDTLTFIIEGNDIFPEVSIQCDRLALVKQTWKADIQPQSEIRIGIVCRNGNPLVDAYLDYMQLSYERRLEMLPDKPLFFQTPAACGKITEFQLSKVDESLIIWRIDSVFGIKDVSFARKGDKASFVTGKTDGLQRFVAFYPSMIHAPQFNGLMEISDLRVLSDKDYVVVTHPDFKAQAEELAQWHQAKNGYRTCVVTTEEIYNVFSSGVQDPSAIRVFMKNLYENSTEDNKPKYLLLFGDVSYDYKNLLSTNSNFLPTLAPPLRDGWSQERGFLGDDDFAFLEAGEGYWNGTAKGDMDVAVGRLPVCTVAEAQAMVRKIKNYAAYGSWRNTIAFVGGKGFIRNLEWKNWFSHPVDSLYPNYNIRKIYQDVFDSLPQIQETRKRIAECFNEGCLFVGYNGHGAPDAWSNDRLLTLEDIDNWDSTRANPILFASACSFAVMDNPFLQSGAEQAVLRPDGGCIASIGGTATLLSGTVEKIQTEFLLSLLSGTGTIGDAYLLAKNSNKNVRAAGFVLLGDPGLKAAVPSLKIDVSLVEEDTTEHRKESSAFSKISLSGKVVGTDGLLKESFNGNLEYKVFSPKETRTLTDVDWEDELLTYQIQEKVLASGEVQVRDGVFDWELLFPKMAAKGTGLVKVSCYAYSDNEDAAGYAEFLLESTLITENEDKKRETANLPLVSVAPNPVNRNSTSWIEFSFAGLENRFDECVLDIFDMKGRRVAQESVSLQGLRGSVWRLDWRKANFSLSSGLHICRFALRKQGSRSITYAYCKLMVL